MTLIALLNPDGSLAGQVETRGSLSAFDDGSNPAKLREVTISRRGTALEQFDSATGKWSEIPALVEAQLVADVKVTAEALKMQRATVGGFKKAEYAAKRNEVVAWDALGTAASAILAAFAALSPAVRQARFEYALADAAAFGDQPANAIERFRAGITAAAQTSRLAGIEAKACAAIAAAPTAVAKRQAHATYWLAKTAG